jgi:hypothetical protein
MKQLSLTISAVALLALATGCGSSGNGGQLVGAPNTMAYRSPAPVGMVFVPSGVLKMGASDEDITGKNETLIRTAQVAGFYMDATEISNSEYRQFTNAIRDSIAHTLLGDMRDNPDGSQSVDYRKAVNYRNPTFRSSSAACISLQNKAAGAVLNSITASWFTTSSISISNHPLRIRRSRAAISSFARTCLSIPTLTFGSVSSLIPTTSLSLASITGSTHSTTIRLWCKLVPGSAFCNWRSKLWRSERERMKSYFESEFRLPSEQEWEWAARGGRNEAPYPWGGPYIVNKKGCYLANFKPQRGNYAADGGLYTTPVKRILRE